MEEKGGEGKKGQTALFYHPVPPNGSVGIDSVESSQRYSVSRYSCLRPHAENKPYQISETESA